MQALHCPAEISATLTTLCNIVNTPWDLHSTFMGVEAFVGTDDRDNVSGGGVNYHGIRSKPRSLQSDKPHSKWCIEYHLGVSVTTGYCVNTRPIRSFSQLGALLTIIISDWGKLLAGVYRWRTERFETKRRWSLTLHRRWFSAWEPLIAGYYLSENLVARRSFYAGIFWRDNGVTNTYMTLYDENEWNALYQITYNWKYAETKVAYNTKFKCN